jgi:hypothetical protein
VTVGVMREDDDPGLTGALLRPGLSEVDLRGERAVAITATSAHAARLRPLGFRVPRQVPLSPAAGVWLSYRPGRVQAP